MIEKDNIKELFSRSLENHTAPVRPEVWNGLQAKMAAAGISSVGAGAKGLSALTKWLIGSAAVTGTAVITTIAILNTSGEAPNKQPAAPAKVKTVSETPVPQQQPAIAVPKESSDMVAERITPASALPERIEPERGGMPEALPEEGITGRANVGTVYQDGVQEDALPVEKNGTITPEVPHVIEEPDIVSEPAVETKPAEREYEKTKIEFPNFFTPNGDGDNEFYKLNVCENVKSVNVRIVSSTDNSIVFTSTDKGFRWNGTVMQSGEPAPKGLYACSVTYEDLGGKTKTVHFIFELIR